MFGWLAFLLDGPHWIRANNRLAIPFLIFEFSLPFLFKAEILPRQPTPEKRSTNESDKMAKWYYLKGEERLGPLEQTAFDELVRQGTIAQETLVWRDGMADWQPYGQAVQAPSAEQMAGDHVACAQCGSVFLKEDVISFRGNFVCANCKPIFMAEITQGVERATELNYAGFWIRFAAKFLDGLLLGILEFFASYLVFGAFFIDIDTPDMFVSWMIFNVFNISARICYAWLLTWKYGGTLGKLALDLRVVTANGEPIGLWRSFGRTFAEILSFLTLLIGYIIAAFDSEKRTLHDHICATRVIRK